MNENLEKLRIVASDLANLAERYAESDPKLSTELLRHAGMIRFSVWQIQTNDISLDYAMKFEWMEWK